jgi:hypothetical protein
VHFRSIQADWAQLNEERAPVSDQAEKQTCLDGDVLRGAKAISDYLGPGWNPEDVYYAHRAKKLPIGKYGKDLISFKSKLDRAIRALVP